MSKLTTKIKQIPTKIKDFQTKMRKLPIRTKLTGWRRIAMFGFSALMVSICLNLALGIRHNHQLRLQEQLVQEKQQEVDNLQRSVDDAIKQLDQHEITEQEFQEQIEKLNKEKEELNKQLQAKHEAEKKAQVAYAAEQKQQVTRPTGTCQEWMTAAGITDQTNAYFIFSKESGCNPTARNRSSGAYGVCQALPASKMASFGSDYLTNPVTQMKWCQSYALSRYGSWANAVAFWNKNHWW